MGDLFSLMQINHYNQMSFITITKTERKIISIHIRIHQEWNTNTWAKGVRFGGKIWSFYINPLRIKDYHILDMIILSMMMKVSYIRISIKYQSIIWIKSCKHSLIMMFSLNISINTIKHNQ